jgi:hypothetical protein
MFQWYYRVTISGRPTGGWDLLASAYPAPADECVPRNGCERDETGISRTIVAAPALTTREIRESVSALYHAAELNFTFGHMSKGRSGYISTVSTYHG